MVDVVVIDEDFRMAALDEFLSQVVGGAVVGHSYDFRAWNHAVAHARLAEIEGVLEDFHLVFNLVVVAGVANARLHEVVEVHFRKFALYHVLVHLDAEDAQAELREERGNLAHGPQKHVAQIGGHGEEGQQAVRIALEECFREKFAREEHDNS